MNKEFIIYEFQKEYTVLDNKLKKSNEDAFKLGLLVAYTSELKNGFIVKRQLKTTNTGTKITYKQIDNQQEADKYQKKIRKMSETIDPINAVNYIEGIMNSNE